MAGNLTFAGEQAKNRLRERLVVDDDATTHPLDLFPQLCDQSGSYL